MESAAPVVALEDECRFVGCGEQLEHTLRHPGCTGWVAGAHGVTQLGRERRERGDGGPRREKFASQNLNIGQMSTGVTGKSGRVPLLYRKSQ